VPDVSIEFDIAREIFTLPRDAVVLMAEDLRCMKPDDATEEREATRAGGQARAQTPIVVWVSQASGALIGTTDIRIRQV